MGYKIDSLKQYFLPNPNCKTPSLATFDPEIRSSPSGSAKLNNIDDPNKIQDLLSEELLSSHLPRKDFWYIKNRFLDHPRFHYLFYSVQIEGDQKALLVLRKLSVEGKKALRIMDILGDVDAVAEIGSAVSELISEMDCEYADFFQYGIKDESLTEAGFILNDRQEGMVIPDYFQPFIKSNVEILFFTSNIENFVITKSDGDQDRPN